MNHLLNFKFYLYKKILRKYDKLYNFDYVNRLYQKFFTDGYELFERDLLTHDLLLSYANFNQVYIKRVLTLWRFIYNFDNSSRSYTDIVYKIKTLLSDISISRILQKNSVLIEIFPINFVKDYIVIRQLLDDLYDYKQDLQCGKRTFTVIHGRQKTLCVINDYKNKLIQNRKVPSFLKYLVKYFY